jgi:DNA-directed RNA polymerase specialized sigma24 family protein
MTSPGLLDALNPRTREIYFSRRSGYTYTEIADDLRIAEITAKRHIARANLTIMEACRIGTPEDRQGDTPSSREVCAARP